MGRDKRNEQRTEHYTILVRNMMEEPAWQALSPTAQALYPWLRLEWRGDKANNNGKIRLSVRQAAERMGVSLNTAAKGFHDLQAKGFLIVTEMACLGFGGTARTTAYELTEISLPNSGKHDGRKLYKQWRRGRDFPVNKARANNPDGSRGNSESHLKIEDVTVLEFETYHKEASQK